MQLIQMSGTLLQTPCAFPSKLFLPFCSASSTLSLSALDIYCALALQAVLPLCKSSSLAIDLLCPALLS